uniref:Uncharacterized protein n=1 Tax=Ditylenchus dipsaci TaxID=166011 RepID=A0A915DDB5_9BILA
MSSLDRDLLYANAEKLVYSQADEFNFDDVPNVMQLMFLDHRSREYGFVAGKLLGVVAVPVFGSPNEWLLY